MPNLCEHLRGLTVAEFPQPRTPIACEQCLAEGSVWVSLRECQACGHIGCCDSSPRKHATRHYHDTQHPVIRSIPPASWTWCYVHESKGELVT